MKGKITQVIEIMPDITPEERDRRVERFIDKFFALQHVPGYLGCEAHGNQVTVFTADDGE